MRRIKSFVAGLSMALLLGSGAASAGSDLNEVGAFLVYPAIASFDFAGQAGLETFVTITNAGSLPVVAHVSYINGDDSSYQYCYECDFEIPLTGNDTETLVVTFSNGATRIVSEDSPLDMTCDWPYGMLVVALQNAAGATITDNVLLGEQVVVDYAKGAAFSIPAIPFQGGASGDGDRVYEFNDSEYGKMPRIVAADFLAPSISDPNSGATLALFTLNFERQFPPLSDCSVTGFDAHEHPFSASFQFGCWGATDLCEISPEFCYPNLGLFSQDSHGWLQLNCRVDVNPGAADGFEAKGGVHGAIIQKQAALSTLAAGSGATILSEAAWARLLYQSVTTGDAVTLHLEGVPESMLP
jgi:hypothetical protein